MTELEKIKVAVSEVIDAKVKDFYVDREIHWAHHQALGEFIDFMKTAKKTAWRTLIASLVVGALSIFVAGWFKWK